MKLQVLQRRARLFRSLFIVEIWQAEKREGPFSPRPCRRAEDPRGAAASGDTAALEILDGWTTEVAAGITGLVHIFDPSVVLIGGGVSAQEELLIRPVRAKVLDTVTPDMASGLVLKAAELGNNAGMVGAVKYFIDRETGR